MPPPAYRAVRGEGLSVSGLEVKGSFSSRTTWALLKGVPDSAVMVMDS